MPTVSVIDLMNVDWPSSLLQCNTELFRMECGDRLDVLVNDPEIAKTLMLVINRAENLSARLVEQNGEIRISVDKKCQ